MFCRDILAAATPFLMIFLLSTVKYDSLAVFLPCAPLAVLPIGGLLVHFLRWRAPITVGRSGPGLAAVTIATLLGGLGTLLWGRVRLLLRGGEAWPTPLSASWVPGVKTACGSCSASPCFQPS